MRLASPISQIFDYPPDAIAAALPDATADIWDAFEGRQVKFAAHRATRTIPFLWRDGADDARRARIAALRADWPVLFDAVSECGERIAGHFGGTPVRLMLTELCAGGRIPRHVDSGETLSRTHRCHMAVITNPGVRFEVGGEVFHPGPGQVYEFDNMRPHAVVNLGVTRRVHLICNVLVGEAAVASA